MRTAPPRHTTIRGTCTTSRSTRVRATSRHFVSLIVPALGFEHLSTTDCGPAGGHLNPYNVSTDCIYQRDCTMFTPERCELGDTTGKLG